jgi:hypothetical protein
MYVGNCCDFWLCDCQLTTWYVTTRYKFRVFWGFSGFDGNECCTWEPNANIYMVNQFMVCILCWVHWTSLGATNLCVAKGFAWAFRTDVAMCPCIMHGLSVWRVSSGETICKITDDTRIGTKTTKKLQTDSRDKKQIATTCLQWYHVVIFKCNRLNYSYFVNVIDYINDYI